MGERSKTFWKCVANKIGDWFLYTKTEKAKLASLLLQITNKFLFKVFFSYLTNSQCDTDTTQPNAKILSMCLKKKKAIIIIPWLNN